MVLLQISFDAGECIQKSGWPYRVGGAAAADKLFIKNKSWRYSKSSQRIFFEGAHLSQKGLTAVKGAIYKSA